MLTAPLSSPQAWCAHFLRETIPVLAHTVEEMETLKLLNEASDTVDARMIANAVESDPLMTLRILAHAASHRRPSQVTDVETVTAAVLLMGITRFFNEFTDLPTANAQLSHTPGAMRGLQQVVRRSRRAAHFAQAIAIERTDEDLAVIYVAALLHDFAEMLLWCHAPVLALEIERRQAADPDLRSTTAQRDVLGCDLATIEHSLMKAWRLPDLLVCMTDDRHAELDQVANVSLAVRIARHSHNGWDNPALPDDFTALAQLLNVLPSAAQALIQRLES